ncbi:MAG: hypothetical protein EOL87_06620 [Spartobacteria bacterium]|nr:hypothetical protein [Spartobacteria bacterium]
MKKILLFISIAVLSTCIHAQEKLDVASLAQSSQSYGKLNLEQSAALIDLIFNSGVQVGVLRCYVGIAPKFRADVTEKTLSVRISKMDSFSTEPIVWSRIGSQIVDFDSDWNKINTIELASYTDPKTLKTDKFYALTLKDNKKGTMIPLDMFPVGYDISDVLAALQVLNGTIPPGDGIVAVVKSSKEEALVAVDEQSMTDMLQPGIELPEPTIRGDRALIDPDADPAKMSAEKTDLYQRMKILKGLYEDGLISDEVYRTKQAELIGEL